MEDSYTQKLDCTGCDFYNRFCSILLRVCNCLAVLSVAQMKGTNSETKQEKGMTEHKLFELHQFIFAASHLLLLEYSVLKAMFHFFGYPLTVPVRNSKANTRNRTIPSVKLIVVLACL